MSIPQRRTLTCLALAASLVACGGSDSMLPADTTTTEGSQTDAEVDSNRPEGWTEASHSNDVEADYDWVFRQDEVMRIDVTIAPEDWQAMLDDMTELFGEFGDTGGTEPPDVPEVALEACDGKHTADACTMLLQGNEVPGSCIQVWDGLIACVPEDRQANQDPAVVACKGLAENDTCQINNGPPGSCLQGPVLACVPEPALQACEGLTEGEACTIVTPGGGLEGTCQLYSGQAACIPAQQNQRPPRGGDQPQGGHLTFADRDPIWVPCTVAVDGQTWWFVGLRFKGNSTLSMTWAQGIYKLPFKFDFDQFEDDHPEVDDQRFYGFKRLAFANNQRDNSLLREKVAGDLLRDHGVPAPRRAFVRVFFDVGEGPQYMGLYTMSEIPDKPLFRDRFLDDEGNLYKPDGPPATWQEGMTVNEDSFSKKSNEEEGDWSDVVAAIAALHADRSDPAAWRAGLEGFFDADGFLRWLAANAVMQNWDVYGNAPHNYYLYGDPGDDGRLHWIPWDHNETFKDGGGVKQPLPLDMASVGDDWPLIRYLVDDPVFEATYWEYLAEFHEQTFEPTSLQARLQTAHDLIAPYVTGEEGEVEGYTVLTSPAAFDSDLADLKAFVQERSDTVAATLAGR